MPQSALSIKLVWEHPANERGRWYCFDRDTERCLGRLIKIAVGWEMYTLDRGYIGWCQTLEAGIETLTVKASLEHTGRRYKL